MAQTVFANGRGIVHKASGGKSIAFPNVCKTPMGPAKVPLPYPSIGQSAKASGGPKTVKVDGQVLMVKGAKYSATEGDAAGTDGGVMSGCNGGEAEFKSYSNDVKFEGRNVCRLGDSLFQNKKNAAG